MNIAEDIARICNKGAEMLGVNIEFNADMINNDNSYVGENYGVPTPAGIEAIKLIAKKRVLF